MSFFNLSNGQGVNATGAMEMGGEIEPIPAKTQVKACISEAGWYHSKTGGDSVISLAWEILAPKEYANRKVFQKIKVRDSDPKKRDKAIMMLAAIDKNCGGKLFLSNREPLDDDLMTHLCNKPMVLLLQVWAMPDENTGETKRGNWVGAVSPLAAKAAPVVVAQPVDEDIPF